MTRIAAAFLALVGLCLPAQSQGPSWGEWHHGPAEFLEYGAWVAELDAGQLVTATILCAADVPYVAVTWLQGEMEQAEAQMQITVDDQPFWLNARYLIYTAEPAWTARLFPEVIDALRGGSTVTVQIAERGPSTLRLNGSASAIDAALQGCGTGAGYHRDWVNFYSFMAVDADGITHPVANLGDPAPSEVPPPAPLPEDAPVTRATLEAGWAELCPTGPDVADRAVRTADFDGDGVQDVIVDTAGIRCDGGPFAMMQGLGNCGMHTCAVFVYLSSAEAPGNWQALVRNHIEIPLTIEDIGGATALGTAVQGGDCPFAEVCRGTWQWDGTEMVYTPTQ
jgi:hypothetical protein